MQENDVAYTGVEGLDALLPSGIPYDSQIMLTGDTGIGKSIFAAQFLYEGVMVGDTCVYIACDDVPNAMRESLKAFKLGSGAYEESGQLILVDAYSRNETGEKHWIPEATILDEFYLYERQLLEKLSDRKVRLVVDSISTLFNQNEFAAFISFNSNRLKLLRRMGVLTLDAYVRGVLDERAVFSLAHTYPVIINMEFQPTENGMRRVIQLGKMKSGEFQANRLPFIISPTSGIVIYR